MTVLKRPRLSEHQDGAPLVGCGVHQGFSGIAPRVAVVPMPEQRLAVRGLVKVAGVLAVQGTILALPQLSAIVTRSGGPHLLGGGRCGPPERVDRLEHLKGSK